MNDNYLLAKQKCIDKNNNSDYYYYNCLVSKELMEQQLFY